LTGKLLPRDRELLIAESQNKVVSGRPEGRPFDDL
jgi:hypothetical protein